MTFVKEIHFRFIFFNMYYVPMSMGPQRAQNALELQLQVVAVPLTWVLMTIFWSSARAVDVPNH